MGVRVEKRRGGQDGSGVKNRWKGGVWDGGGKGKRINRKTGFQVEEEKNKREMT